MVTLEGSYAFQIRPTQIDWLTCSSVVIEKPHDSLSAMAKLLVVVIIWLITAD